MSSKRHSNGFDFDPPARNVLLANLVTTIFVALGVLATVIVVLVIAVRQNGGTTASAASLEFLSLDPSAIGISAYNGVANDTVHRYAGKAIRMIPGGLCNSKQSYTYGCGASLVDIPGLPNRRMVITAGHCVVSSQVAHPRYVSFDVVHDGTFAACDGTIRLVDLDMTRWYHVKKAWTANDGSTLSSLKTDWAIFLLDEEVPSSVVPQPAVIVASPDVKSLTPNVLPVTGMAGYGISGYGPDGQVDVGRPLRVIGPGNRMYVEMDVNSVTSFNIVNQAVSVLGQSGTCGGDSGSAGISPTSGAPWMIWGTITAGDKWCRATNTFTRVDTPNYRAWLQSIQADILANA